MLNYTLYDDYGIGYTNNNEIFYFSISDYDLIKDYTWHTDKDGYLVANTYINNKRKKIKMHRLIMNPPTNKVIDHINHKVYDNRRENLRICTQVENNKNIALRKDNKIGVIGVEWIEDRHKWRARIRVNKKSIHLGMYENLEDAIKARKQAEIKYFSQYIDKGNI